MFSLKNRSQLSEIIDDPAALDSRQMRAVLEELRTVNSWLGGTRILLSQLKPLLLGLAKRSPHRPLRLIDFGSGSADIPQAIARWCARRQIPITIVAVDFNHLTAQVARESTESCVIQSVQADVLAPPFRRKSLDIVFCSAFLHHFTDAQILQILKAFQSLSRSAAVVSDLARHPLAFAGIWLLTRLFSRSPAIRNDGPLSVRKSFQRKDWVRLLKEAGWENAVIRWHWPFRHSIRLEW